MATVNVRVSAETRLALTELSARSGLPVPALIEHALRIAGPKLETIAKAIDALRPAR